MATYRGQDGSVALGTNVVGEIDSWEMDAKLDTLETTKMGDTFHGYRTGLSGGTGRAVAHFDYGDTNGQKVLADLIFGATPAGTIANLRLRLSATKYFSGAAILTQTVIRGSLTTLFMVDFSFLFNGEIDVVWS